MITDKLYDPAGLPDLAVIDIAFPVMAWRRRLSANGGVLVIWGGGGAYNRVLSVERLS